MRLKSVKNCRKLVTPVTHSAFFMKIVTTDTNFLLEHFRRHVRTFTRYIFPNFENSVVLYGLYNTFLSPLEILI